MRVLILGGTRDAKQLATELAEPLALLGGKVLYSVAGRMGTAHDYSIPACELVCGGFSQHGGMLNWCRQSGMDLVVDATHPYAARISANAVAACAQIGLPCLRLERESWIERLQQSAVAYSAYEDWSALLAAVPTGARPFFSTGQPPPSVSAWLTHALASGQIKGAVGRSAVPPISIPVGMRWVVATGPFTLAAERELLLQACVTHVISKDSGGAATYAKITAAQQLGLPVMLLARPVLPPLAAQNRFDTLAACREAVLRWARSKHEE